MTADAHQWKHGGSESVELPPLQVRTAKRDVAAFASATGGALELGSVPLTFPACWLALPPVRALITDSIGAGFLPVHEAQNFTYERGLELDCDYALCVEASRTEPPPRLTLRISVANPQGEICARLETVLRIVPTGPGPAL